MIDKWCFFLWYFRYLSVVSHIKTADWRNISLLLLLIRCLSNRVSTFFFNVNLGLVSLVLFLVMLIIFVASWINGFSSLNAFFKCLDVRSSYFFQSRFLDLELFLQSFIDVKLLKRYPHTFRCHWKSREGVFWKPYFTMDYILVVRSLLRFKASLTQSNF